MASVFGSLMGGGARQMLLGVQGEPATYGGAAVTVIPMMGQKRESMQDGRGVSWDVEKSFQVAKAQVAAPVYGDVLVHAGVSYSVQEADETAAGMWSLKCVRIEPQERRNNEQVMQR